MLAGGGTYLSSTLQTIVTQADVFAHSMLTFSQGGGVGPFLSDDYAITDTLDLVPDHVYFGDVNAGCDQNSSPVSEDWACSGHASATFALDQEAFDASMGGESFDPAAFVSIERSPNLAPEPSARSLGASALAVLGLATWGRRSGRATAAAILRA